MAQIIIREKDLTGNPASSVFDVAFVPGLLGYRVVKVLNQETGENELVKVMGGEKWQEKFFNKPIYFASLSEFQQVIGSRACQLTGDGIPFRWADNKLSVPEVDETSTSEVLYDVHSLFLNDNLVEHHGTAPHAATRRELAVKLSHLQPCLSQIISSNNTRRTSANNGYIEIEITLKFVKIGTDNTFGYLCFNHFFKVIYFLK